MNLEAFRAHVAEAAPRLLAQRVDPKEAKRR